MRVLLMHWGQTGAGPRFLHSLASTWDREYPGEVAWSFNAEAHQANTYRALALPSLAVRTYKRSTYGIVLGLPRLPKLGYDLTRFIRTHSIDSVISVMPSIFQSAVAPLVIPSNVRYITCIHDAVPHLGEANLVTSMLPRMELRRADVVVAFSSAVADSIQEHYGRSGKPIVTTVHPAWSSELQGTIPPRTLPEGRPINIGFFGRLISYKGLDTLVAACRLLVRDGFNIRLLVHGQGPDSALQTMAGDIPGEWDIRWIDDTEILDITAQFDVLALPYREASQSGVLAQALTMGVPSVSTPVGGLREQMDGTGAGVVATNSTPEAFAAALRLLISDPVLYRQCSRNALNAAETNYSWTRTVSDIRNATTSRLSCTEEARTAPE